MSASSEKAATVDSTVLSSDGTEIAFERSGTGPTVILVSSALADRSDTTKLAGLLARHFTVINYDRRGRGASGDGPDYAVEREIADIAALISHVGGSASMFGSLDQRVPNRGREQDHEQAPTGRRPTGQPAQRPRRVREVVHLHPGGVQHRRSSTGRCTTPALGARAPGAEGRGSSAGIGWFTRSWVRGGARARRLSFGIRGSGCGLRDSSALG